MIIKRCIIGEMQNNKCIMVLGELYIIQQVFGRNIDNEKIFIYYFDSNI